MRRTLKAIVIVACCLLLGKQGMAQKGSVDNPGYLGKRNSISYHAMVFPALGLINAYESRRGMKPGLFQRGGSLFLNASHQITLDRTLSKRASFGLACEYAPLGDSKELLDSVQHYLINATGGGFQVKFFPFRRKGAMAPIGPYTRLDAKLYRTALKFGNPEDDNFKELIENRHFMAFSMEFGINNVVWDALLLTAAVRYSLTGIGLDTESRPWKSVVQDRLFDHDLIKMNLGIGYLF